MPTKIASEDGVVEAVAIAVGIVHSAKQFERADPVLDETGAAWRVEHELFQRLDDRRRLDVDAIDLPVDPAVSVDDRRLGEMIETLGTGIEQETEIVAELIDNAGVGGKKVPVRYVVSRLGATGTRACDPVCLPASRSRP